MKKIVYLAPIFLLSFLGKGVAASQVEHVSSLDRAVEQMNEAPANTQQNMLGKGVAASQVEHASSLNGAVEQMNEASADTQQNMLGKGVAASQVEHASSLNGAVEQTNKASADTQQNMQIKNKQPVYPIELEEKAYMDDTITINNPANHQIIVHYVNPDGSDIGLADSTIDLSSKPTGSDPFSDAYSITSHGSYISPDNRYSLSYPDGQYTIKHAKETISVPAVTHFDTTVLPDSRGTASARYTNSGQHIRLALGEDPDVGVGYITGDDGQWHESESDRYIDSQPLAGRAQSELNELRKLAFGHGLRYYSSGHHAIKNPTVTFDYDFSHNSRFLVVDSPAHIEHINTFSFTDNSGNIASYSGNEINVVLNHKTQPIDANGTNFGNNASSNVFIIDGDSKKQINTQTRSFKTTGLLDLVTNATQISGNWQATAKPNFDEVTLAAPIGYDSLNSKLLTLTL